MSKGFVPPAFGRSVKRKEDRRLLTGQGHYTDDRNLPGQRYAAFVRSSHDHAMIAAIDTEHARQMPGALAVLTGSDFAASGLGALTCGWMIHSRNGEEMRASQRPALTRDVVRYVGDAVALVIAESRHAARDGADLVEMDYQDLPAVVDVAMAGLPDAAQLHECIASNEAFDWELGEAGAIGAPPAVINAITDALGVKEFDMPATPEKVWRVIREQGL